MIPILMLAMANVENCNFPPKCCVPGQPKFGPGGYTCCNTCTVCPQLCGATTPPPTPAPPTPYPTPVPPTPPPTPFPTPGAAPPGGWWRVAPNSWQLTLVRNTAAPDFEGCVALTREALNRAELPHGSCAQQCEELRQPGHRLSGMQGSQFTCNVYLEKNYPYKCQPLACRACSSIMNCSAYPYSCGNGPHGDGFCAWSSDGPYAWNVYTSEAYIEPRSPAGGLAGAKPPAWYEVSAAGMQRKSGCLPTYVGFATPPSFPLNGFSSRSLAWCKDACAQRSGGAGPCNTITWDSATASCTLHTCFERQVQHMGEPFSWLQFTTSAPDQPVSSTTSVHTMLPWTSQSPCPATAPACGGGASSPGSSPGGAQGKGTGGAAGGGGSSGSSGAEGGGGSSRSSGAGGGGDGSLGSDSGAGNAGGSHSAAVGLGVGLGIGLLALLAAAFAFTRRGQPYGRSRTMLSSVKSFGIHRDARSTSTDSGPTQTGQGGTAGRPGALAQQATTNPVMSQSEHVGIQMASSQVSQPVAVFCTQCGARFADANQRFCTACGTARFQ